MTSSKKNSLIAGFGREGWGVIIYCAAMFWFYVGMVNDGSNITAPAFAANTGIDYSMVLSMGSVAGFVGFLFFIIFGQINIRLGAKNTSAICMLIAGLAYIGIGFSSSLIGYAVCLCLVTGSVMSGGYIAGGTLVAKWFPKKKGIVMGYTTMGHNLASALYVPMIAFLVNSLGLRTGVLVPSVLVMILGLIGLLMIKNTPEEIGILPDNVSKETYMKEYDTSDLVKDSTGGWTVKSLLSERETWLAASTTGIYQLVTVGVMTQLVVRNMQLGFTQGQAITIMSILAAIGVIGSWLFGVLDSKYGTKPTMIFFGFWYMAALVFNVLETRTSIFLSVFMIGMAIGGSANFTTSLPAAIFGRHGFEKVNSVIFPIQGLITSLNFLLSGISIALTGSLRGVYMLFIGILAVNILLILLVNEHKFNRDYQAEEGLEANKAVS
ncbi:MFS transporter [Acidaminobacter hydrogenoformans]|uniref:Sugar phosphate permease n=1 Tax=Acidaminobacter hydrogenoformans DSM 2784 TaxID=1120920 RepID=A0A1G5RX37_9FIRM|nr:MFS transporter [Acidaminobacter hydrogenoformans]SCZ78603.1 Sugar phosphate permease [Acidaminobacter hydrogenoformans DSM 2784]